MTQHFHIHFFPQPFTYVESQQFSWLSTCQAPICWLWDVVGLYFPVPVGKLECSGKAHWYLYFFDWQNRVNFRKLFNLPIFPKIANKGVWAHPGGSNLGFKRLQKTMELENKNNTFYIYAFGSWARWSFVNLEENKILREGGNLTSYVSTMSDSQCH